MGKVATPVEQSEVFEALFVLSGRITDGRAAADDVLGTNTLDYRPPPFLYVSHTHHFHQYASTTTTFLAGRFSVSLCDELVAGRPRPEVGPSAYVDYGSMSRPSNAPVVVGFSAPRSAHDRGHGLAGAGFSTTAKLCRHANSGGYDRRDSPETSFHPGTSP